jgi:hypothetical protein
VKLVEAGSEPRTELRYEFQRGARSSLEIHMKMKSTVQVEKSDMKVDTGMRYGVDMEVVDVQGDQATLSFVNRDFELVDDETSPLLKQAMGQMGDIMRGMRGTMVMDRRGRIVEMQMDLSSLPPELQQTMGQMQDSMRQISALLPEEAVGAGARWKVYQIVQSQGIELKQQIEATLVELSDSKATLKTRILQDADMQIAKMAGMGGAGSTEVSEFYSKGSGRMVLDLGGITVDSMDMDLRTKGKLKMKMGDARMKMGMKADIHMDMSSR